jgi:glutathione S-transferase
MPKTTLTYFDTPSSRGEECRLALHLAGVEFVDERLKPAEFAARKASTPFGTLPVLTIEGHAPLAQTNTILRLIGRAHGLHPTETWAAAREEAIMSAVEDLRQRMTPLGRIKDEAEKRRAREEFAAGYLREWAEHLQRQIGEGPFVGGGEIHVADLKLFVILGAYLRGTFDYISADVFTPFPKLLAVYHAVKNHPKIQAWYSR